MRQYKKYERYKDTGVEWIGKIPEEWDLSKIKYIPKYEYKSFVDGDWIESPYITDEGIRLIQTGNIGIGSYKEQGYRYISEDTFKDLNCTEVYPNDVLICRLAGPVGRACLAPSLTERMITSVDVCILKPKDNIDRRYLVYILSYDGYLQEADFLARGGTRQRISRTQLGNINILLPPTDQQKSIANFLDQKTAEIDGLIADKEKLIELLQEKRQAIITETVTKGLNPNVKMKDSGIEWIGEIPEHWNVEPIKYMVKTIQTGTTPTTKNDDYFDGDIQWFTPGDFHGSKELYEASRKISNLAVIDNEARLFPKNTVMIVGIGATVGKVAKLGVEGSFNQQITGLIVNEQRLNCDYLYYWLYINQETIKNISNYTTLPIINNEFVKNFECLSLPLDEQQAIVNYLNQKTSEIDDLILKIRLQIQKLKEYRQSLISEAVTGKIDVREFGSISEVI
jgi:type I restriction enzyme S subunit